EDEVGQILHATDDALCLPFERCLAPTDQPRVRLHLHKDPVAHPRVDDHRPDLRDPHRVPPRAPTRPRPLCTMSHCYRGAEQSSEIVSSCILLRLMNIQSIQFCCRGRTGKGEASHRVRSAESGSASVRIKETMHESQPT